MVDEYQDTNHAQYHLLKLLSEKNKNLMVVGDDDQSIYSWRGARIKNILDFEKDFPKCKVIRLETNYRSTANIIACANNLISNNLERKQKKLIVASSSNRTQTQQGEKVLVHEAGNPLEEATKVADAIRAKMFKDNLNYGDFAILYRAKHQNKPIKEVFAQRKIPYQVWGEIDFFNRQEIRDLIALAKLLTHPQDDLSFLRMINKPRRMREVCLQKLLAFGSEIHSNIYELFHSQEKSIQKKIDEILKPSEKDKLSVFFHFIDSYQNLQGEKTSEGFKKFINDVEYMSYLHLVKEKEETLQRREQNIEQFFVIIKKYFDNKKQSGLKSFIEQISIAYQKDLDDQDEKNVKNMVNLLTIHNAKGLEFPHVFIVGMEENILPFFKDGFPTSLEEERRLCYVALTRAKESCTLSLCKKRKSLEGEVSNSPSRFLKEIPNEFLIRQYRGFNEKIPEPSEKEKIEMSKKAFSRMKEILNKS
ncbi:ATP-dependent DNA helicase Rep-like [Ylistrum balloti]|uniref:ATP-dependent DNA helicase Rep-like n=1 Tax=Ylistrum balloti TaxID=509963 RepID=UPI002905B355|nr:ATP-dependent DNA helicase Rep-like [Ylistrum balloti]